MHQLVSCHIQPGCHQPTHHQNPQPPASTPSMLSHFNNIVAQRPCMPRHLPNCCSILWPKRPCTPRHPPNCQPKLNQQRSWTPTLLSSMSCLTGYQGHQSQQLLCRRPSHSQQNSWPNPLYIPCRPRNLKLTFKNGGCKQDTMNGPWEKMYAVALNGCTV